jgi:hypothetical protein
VDKPTASAYSASVNSTRGLSPLDWGDKCFLCGNTIGEGAQQSFWQHPKGGFYRNHRGCQDKMDMVGGTPRAFHEYIEAQAKKKAPSQHVQPEPAPPAPELEDDQPTVNTYKGPKVIQFEDFGHLQRHIAQSGPLPSFVRVLVGEYVMQAGGA